jgi:predicted nucleic acid-binding protein
MKARVFLDASFWIAYRDARQPDYSRANELVRHFFRERKNFATIVPVFCEIHAHFARHMKRRDEIISDFWHNPLMHLEPLIPADYDEALGILKKQRDKNYPFCDVLSFVAMRRLGIKQAASFDEHFRQFGEFEIIS